MHKTGYRAISNTRITSRFRQVMVLILTILIGILISISANA